MPVVLQDYKPTQLVKPSGMKDGQIGRINKSPRHGDIGRIVERKGDDLSCLGMANSTTWQGGCRSHSNLEVDCEIEILPNGTTIRIVENE